MECTGDGRLARRHPVSRAGALFGPNGLPPECLFFFSPPRLFLLKIGTRSRAAVPPSRIEPFPAEAAETRHCGEARPREIKALKAGAGLNGADQLLSVPLKAASCKKTLSDSVCISSFVYWGAFYRVALALWLWKRIISTSRGGGLENSISKHREINRNTKNTKEQQLST